MMFTYQFVSLAKYLIANYLIEDLINKKIKTMETKENNIFSETSHGNCTARNAKKIKT